MTWTVIVALVYAFSVAVAVTLGRRRRWLTHAAMSVLVLVAIIGLGAVQNSTGYAIY